MLTKWMNEKQCLKKTWLKFKALKTDVTKLYYVLALTIKNHFFFLSNSEPCQVNKFLVERMLLPLLFVNLLNEQKRNVYTNFNDFCSKINKNSDR